MPPAGAIFDRVIVHVVLELEATVVGAHCREEMVAGAEDVSEIVVGIEEPFRVAVIVTDWSELNEPEAAKKVAEVAFAGTITAEGTVNR
jgi:hypothetical protein